MPRYTRPKAGAWVDDDWERFGFDEDPALLPGLTVDEHIATDTGLIWATGEPIMREPNPMGFGRDNEW